MNMEDNNLENLEEAPAEKKTNTTKIVLIVVGVLALCCCVTAAVAWFAGDAIINALGF